MNIRTLKLIYCRFFLNLMLFFRRLKHHPPTTLNLCIVRTDNNHTKYTCFSVCKYVDRPTSTKKISSGTSIEHKVDGA